MVSIYFVAGYCLASSAVMTLWRVTNLYIALFTVSAGVSTLLT